MDRVAIGPVKGLRIAVAAFVISIVLCLVVIGGAIYLGATRQNDLSGFTEKLHAGLVENCEKNGNPLREAVQEMLKAEINRTNFALLQKLFPQVPPSRLRALVAEKAADERRTIRRISPLNCASQYPRP